MLGDKFKSWAEREREELARRKQIDAEKSDPELEQCVIAYHAFRVAGGQGKFAEFRMDWLKRQEPSNGPHP
jgi:hypothetical protein